MIFRLRSVNIVATTSGDVSSPKIVCQILFINSGSRSAKASQREDDSGHPQVVKLTVLMSHAHARARSISEAYEGRSRSSCITVQTQSHAAWVTPLTAGWSRFQTFTWTPNRLAAATLRHPSGK